VCVCVCVGVWVCVLSNTGIQTARRTAPVQYVLSPAGQQVRVAGLQIDTARVHPARRRRRILEVDCDAQRVAETEREAVGEISELSVVGRVERVLIGVTRPLVAVCEQASLSE